MALDVSRRSLITGLIAFAAAPAIVRAESLMPVKVMKPVIFRSGHGLRSDYGRMLYTLTHDGLYEIWWVPGEDAPRIKNVTPECVDSPNPRITPVSIGP